MIFRVFSASAKRRWYILECRSKYLIFSAFLVLSWWVSRQNKTCHLHLRKSNESTAFVSILSLYFKFAEVVLLVSGSVLTARMVTVSTLCTPMRILPVANVTSPDRMQQVTGEWMVCWDAFSAWFLVPNIISWRKIADVLSKQNFPILLCQHLWTMHGRITCSFSFYLCVCLSGCLSVWPSACVFVVLCIFMRGHIVFMTSKTISHIHQQHNCVIQCAHVVRSTCENEKCQMDTFLNHCYTQTPVCGDDQWNQSGLSNFWKEFRRNWYWPLRNNLKRNGNWREQN